MQLINEEEQRIVHDLILRELKSAIKIYPNVQTLAEFKEHSKKQNYKHWLTLFALEERLFWNITSVYGMLDKFVENQGGTNG